MIDLNAVKARLGSLSFDARVRLASICPAAFRMVTIDLPAVIAELEAAWAREAERGS